MSESSGGPAVGCLCGSGRTRRRIFPEDGNDGYHMLSLREHRRLRIGHLNPRPRSKEFEKQMELFQDIQRNKTRRQQLKQSLNSNSGNVQLTGVNTIQENNGCSNDEPCPNDRLDDDITNIKTNSTQHMDHEESYKVFQTSPTMDNVFQYPNTADNDTHKSKSTSHSIIPSDTNSELNSKGENVVMEEMNQSSNKLNGAKNTTDYSKNISSEVSVTEDHVNNDTITGGDHMKNVDLEKTTSAKNIVVNISSQSSDLNSTVNKTQEDNMNSKAMSNEEHTKDLVLFFIHGVAGSSNVWHSQLEYFKKLGYEIISPDLIGHGFSSAPNDPKAYDFQEIVCDLLEIFDKYCKKKNVVIGHSYGASFAAVLARQRSRRVEKLIMLNGGAPTPLAPQPGIFDKPMCLLTCVHPILKCGFFRKAFHKNKKSYIPREKAFDVPTYVLRHMMRGQNWLEGDEEYHNALNVPTLLLHGKTDQLVGIEEEQAMQEAIFGSQLIVVEDASHMMMMEQPAKVNEIIHHFLLQNMKLVMSRPTTPHSPHGPSRSSTSIRW